MNPRMWIQKGEFRNVNNSRNWIHGCEFTFLNPKNWIVKKLTKTWLKQDWRGPTKTHNIKRLIKKMKTFDKSFYARSIFYSIVLVGGLFYAAFVKTFLLYVAFSKTFSWYNRGWVFGKNFFWFLKMFMLSTIPAPKVFKFSNNVPKIFKISTQDHIIFYYYSYYYHKNRYIKGNIPASHIIIKKIF